MHSSLKKAHTYMDKRSGLIESMIAKKIHEQKYFYIDWHLKAPQFASKNKKKNLNVS